MVCLVIVSGHVVRLGIDVGVGIVSDVIVDCKRTPHGEVCIVQYIRPCVAILKAYAVLPSQSKYHIL